MSVYKTSWFRKGYNVDTSLLTLNKSLGSTRDIGLKFGDTLDSNDDMLNFAGVQLDLNQSYYQVYKSQNDYWQEWNTSFTTARTNYDT